MSLRRSAEAQLRRLRFEGPGVLSSLLLRPKTVGVNKDIVREVWPAVADGRHNSNTDLTFWNGHYYLCHQTSPYHMGSSRSRMRLLRSTDARTWELVTEFAYRELSDDLLAEWGTWGEFRDPTFAQIHGRLFIYLLPNKDFTAEPFTTLYTYSDDGDTWSPLVEVNQPGWLYWRPKTLDGETWYATAYWHEHGKSCLLKSNDGLSWEMVSTIFEGERNDETDFEFLPDGRILSTARLEGTGNDWGDDHAATLLSVASPPYETWSHKRSSVTRFDGPCLFPYNGRVHGIGRSQATHAPFFAECGGMYSRKRTSLFLVEEDRMRILSDLPSAADTSYAGIVIQGDEAVISYYTSPPDRDFTWIQGMLRPTNIMMARLDLAAMERVAQA